MVTIRHVLRPRFALIAFYTALLASVFYGSQLVVAQILQMLGLPPITFISTAIVSIVIWAIFRFSRPESAEFAVIAPLLLGLSTLSGPDDTALEWWSLHVAVILLVCWRIHDEVTREHS